MSAPTNGKVYFGKCFSLDGYDLKVVKIGCAGNPEQRVRQVQTGQPFRVELAAFMPGDMFLEFFIHMWLREEAVSGEFFRLGSETARLLDHVKETGTHPFPIIWSEPEGWFKTLDVVQFMGRHDITLSEVRKLSGATCKAYDVLLKKERCGNRRFLAALAVAAVKKGIQIDWPKDFRGDVSATHTGTQRVA
jgi:hypothetical protein